MDVDGQAGQHYEDECISIDEYTYCGTVLQRQKEFEEVLVKDEAW